MKRIAAKKGSALLIVLGMIGIMIVSAVAFSAWMRYSRLPSSYLRRNSASRHLAHSAMALAIDEIDAAIGHNPHPGVGIEDTYYPRPGQQNSDSEKAYRNIWWDHCYWGTNTLLEAKDTVSVLNLEALAYIPPTIVNEARYYSRHVPSATWKSLGYDAGRYAFFAIDVSDFLDANKTFANCGRNSSDRGKFTLAHAFENATHEGYLANPSVWDSFLEEYIDVDAFLRGTIPSKMSFRSLADMSLALYSYKNYLAPIIGYLKGSSPIDEFPSDTLQWKYFTVVADGLSPSCVAKDNLPGDLSDPRRQPFSGMGKNEKPSNYDVIMKKIQSGTSGEILSETLCELDMISLYDYLDENDIPTSLAMPTTERVPMICGLEPFVQLEFKPKVEVTYPVEGASKPSPEDCKAVGDFYYEKKSCKFTDILFMGRMDLMYMFPFHRGKDTENSGFNGEVSIRICFGVDGSPGLRTSKGSAYVVQSSGDFPAVAANCVKYGALQPTVTPATVQLSFPNVDEPKNALKKTQTDFIFNDIRTWFNNNELFWVKKKYKVTALNPNTGKPVFTEMVDDHDAGVNLDFHPVNKDGTGDGGFTIALLKEGKGVTVRPYMTITARVTKDADTVDLVPACFRDDNIYNSVEQDYNLANIAGGKENGQPIMTFCGDKDIEFSVAAFEKMTEKVTIKIHPSGGEGSCVFCPDPRWNFAPENFICKSQELKDELYTASGNPECGLGLEGRDKDLFMFVSNQGYMQSVSELAFLPRMSIDMGGGNNRTGNAAFTFDYDDFKTNVKEAKNWDLMWRTYRLYPQGDPGNLLSTDGIYNLGVFDGGRGQRINPYSTSHNAIMAAFANTPYSWRVASTNTDSQVNVAATSMDDAKDFNTKYAFNAMNDKAKFEWGDLTNVAARVSRAMLEADDGDWVAGYDALDWAGNSDDDLFGTKYIKGDTCELYDVDRKFLYGFWRDCFAAKQQLFLVFVRAEPVMMGSGMAGHDPPQLGAKAMALVWRNPAPGSITGIAGGKRAWPKSMADIVREEMGVTDSGDPPENRPHQTRILFYRQFE